MSEMQLLTMPPKLQRTFPALCLLGVLFLSQSLPVLCALMKARDGKGCQCFLNIFENDKLEGLIQLLILEMTMKLFSWMNMTGLDQFSKLGTKSCSHPPLIAHGRSIQKSSYLFQPKEVQYECDEGYTLVGEATLFCSSSRWSGPAPQCKALCPKPKIEHGKVFGDKDQFVESENVTIECASGYTVVGPQNITCLKNHTWYPEVPKCEWEVPPGYEQVLAGRKLLQCLLRPEDVRMALEMYKLSLEIEILELQREERKSTLKSSL